MDSKKELGAFYVSTTKGEVVSKRVLFGTPSPIEMVAGI